MLQGEQDKGNAEDHNERDRSSIIPGPRGSAKSERNDEEDVNGCIEHDAKPVNMLELLTEWSVWLGLKSFQNKQVHWCKGRKDEQVDVESLFESAMNVGMDRMNTHPAPGRRTVGEGTTNHWTKDTACAPNKASETHVHRSLMH